MSTLATPFCGCLSVLSISIPSTDSSVQGREVSSVVDETVVEALTLSVVRVVFSLVVDLTKQNYYQTDRSWCNNKQVNFVNIE